MSDGLAKLVSLEGAFDSGVTLGIIIGVGAALLIAPALILGLARAGRLADDHRRELIQRYLAWLVMAPLIIGPVLLGPGCTIIAVGLLSLLCYREFARATGFFRNRGISAAVVVGVLALTFAAYDHWYDLFVAIPSLTIALIAIIALARDDPKGYIQRIALGVLAFLLFGVCLGHLGYMANDGNYRPILLLIVLCVEANDVFAYICGKLLGRVRLAPNTSPNKTIEGSLGSLVLTGILFASIGHFVFREGPLASTLHLLATGALLSLVGQFGDLVISSVKRDLGIKDMGVLIPGHGGMLDRFDSLVLVAPAMFHYIGYFEGFGLGQPVRVITGGGGG